MWRPFASSLSQVTDIAGPAGAAGALVHVERRLEVMSCDHRDRCFGHCDPSGSNPLLDGGEPNETSRSGFVRNHRRREDSAAESPGARPSREARQRGSKAGPCHKWISHLLIYSVHLAANTRRHIHTGPSLCRGFRLLSRISLSPPSPLHKLCPHSSLCPRRLLSLPCRTLPRCLYPSPPAPPADPIPRLASRFTPSLLVRHRRPIPPKSCSSSLPILIPHPQVVVPGAQQVLPADDPTTTQNLLSTIAPHQFPVVCSAQPANSSHSLVSVVRFGHCIPPQSPCPMGWTTSHPPHASPPRLCVTSPYCS
ncbi:hypothetical protein CALVIDRAFT_579546 [Calocera viscosa TUFC12733]|uniref:Uncharacterized protein n=1 Tax=Calocera viscosa (strain TUFC12733) TaxID=1330018 RepID=A0A167KWV6_CALVF|nr:hypothetical protein CALVIDRAFT_579546 [Calocera viscosa TUFC12733]